MIRRRAVLRGAGAVGLVAVAGCLGAGGGQITTTGGPTTTAASTTSAPATTGGATTGAATPGPTSATGPAPTGTGMAGGSRTVDVAAGPEGRLRFVPDRVEIRVGDAVRWTFESAGHNVTTKPGASEKVDIPADAEPFASYEDDQHYAVVQPGDSFEHTFTVPGEYVYVCAPHADQGMVGTVVVTGS